MLKFYCTYLNSNIDPIFFFECLKRTKDNNIMFSFVDGNFLVKKQINGDFELFQVKPEFIDGLDEGFYHKILKLILDAHNKAINLKTENEKESSDCSLQHDGELEGLIHSAMMGIAYQNYGILDFVIHIVFRITTKQI
jgi:DNA-binding protein YbaB